MEKDKPEKQNMNLTIRKGNKVSSNWHNQTYSTESGKTTGLNVVLGK